MANISNVINVALIPEGQLAARDNMNVICVITSDTTVLTSAERYRIYTDAASVASDFGSSSDVTAYANTVFGTQPNAINFGGSLVIGYHRAADETVAASAASLVSPQLAESTLIPQLQAISDGSFDIDVDGVTVNVTGLDFRTVTTLEDVATLLDDVATGIVGATVTIDNAKLKIVSNTTGATSLLTVASAGATGTFVGNLLEIASGSGATLTQGAASSVLSAETKLAALTEIKSQINIKGVCFIDLVLDAEVPDLAAFVQANSMLMYNVFSGSSYLTISATNPAWTVKLTGQDSFRMLYSKAGNRKLAASYMARAHTVNFNAENSAITMNLKELAVAAESYTQTEITNAYNVGLDLYTTIKSTPIVLSSPANDFQDNVYNLIAFIDAVQTDMFNLLKQTGTKIPQTQRGVNQLIDQAEKTTRGFVRAGVFAPGTWSSPDSFGDITTFKRNISEFGFYWLAGSLADQPQVDRQNRISPVLQGAVKAAGALEKINIIINFNK